MAAADGHGANLGAGGGGSPGDQPDRSDREDVVGLVGHAHADERSGPHVRDRQRRLALVLALVAASAALLTIGPSPGVGPLLASCMIVFSAALPLETFNRLLHRSLTLLPAVIYVVVALTLTQVLNSHQRYGAPQFYASVAIVIPTLLIALSLTGRVFSSRPRVLYEVALSLFILYSMGESEFHALRAVYIQRGDKDDFLLAVSGLAAGFATVVFAAILDESAVRRVSRPPDPSQEPDFGGD